MASLVLGNDAHCRTELRVFSAVSGKRTYESAVGLANAPFSSILDRDLEEGPRGVDWSFGQRRSLA